MLSHCYACQNQNADSSSDCIHCVSCTGFPSLSVWNCSTLTASLISHFLMAFVLEIFYMLKRALRHVSIPSDKQANRSINLNYRIIQYENILIKPLTSEQNEMLYKASGRKSYKEEDGLRVALHTKWQHLGCLGHLHCVAPARSNV